MSKAIVGPFTGSFPHLFEAHAVNVGDDPKFSIQCVMPKSDPQWAELEKAAKQCAKDRWGKVPAKLQLPMNDGDATDRDEVQGCYYMNLTAKADRPPQVVGKDRQPIVDPSEVYAGAQYFASCRPYAWEYGGKKGVSFGLNHVMKAADGDRLDGRGSADTDFADLDLDQFQDDDDLDDVL